MLDLVWEFWFLRGLEGSQSEVMNGFIDVDSWTDLSSLDHRLINKSW